MKKLYMLSVNITSFFVKSSILSVKFKFENQLESSLNDCVTALIDLELATLVYLQYSP